MFKVLHHGWIGFDLGTTSVKLAQVVRRGDEYRLSAAAMVPRRKRWSVNDLGEVGPLSSADEIDAAASLCERIGGSSAAASLPSAVCEILPIEAPAKRAPADVIRAIEAETDRSMRDRLYDAWPVGLQPKKMNVATAPLAWSEQVFADVARRGRSCQLIDAIPWALARATLLASHQNRGRMLAALDWGYGKATMCLVHQGAPAVVRTLKECGFQRILNVIAKSLRLDERDAELLLQKYGLTGGAAEQRNSSSVVENVLREPLSHLIDELRRTLGYWQGLTRGKMPEALYLFGGGAALAGVDRFLNAALDLPVERWSLAADETVDPESAPPACLLGTAAGLSAAAWETL